VSAPLLPRYTVGAVSGYRYMTVTTYIANDATSSNRRPISTWYVYDRYFCFEPVAAFDDRRRYLPWSKLTMIRAEQQARSKARKLNKRHRKWLRAQGLL